MGLVIRAARNERSRDWEKGERSGTEKQREALERGERRKTQVIPEF